MRLPLDLSLNLALNLALNPPTGLPLNRMPAPAGPASARDVRSEAA